MPAQASLQFQPTVSKLDFEPRVVAAGDLNADGLVDVVLIDNAGGALVVLIGNGNGKFSTAVRYAMVDPVDVALGDMDRDGKIDAVVACGRQVAVALGDGSGAFNSPSYYPIGGHAESLALADIDSDGLTDAATTYYNDLSSDSGVSVLLGNPDGSLRPKTDYLTESDLWSLAVGDVNGDGMKDLALAQLSGGVLILLNQGSGVLGIQSRVLPDQPTTAVAVGDFNRDGIEDLASTTNPGTLVVLTGQSFVASSTTVLGAGPNSIAVADFDLDGWTDIATANSSDSSVSFVLRGPSAGPGAWDIKVGDWPTSIAVADFDGDGTTDVAVANQRDLTLSVLLQERVSLP